MKIAVFANTGRTKVRKNLVLLKKILKKEGVEIKASGFDTAFVLGGDGWLLKTLRALAEKNVPVYFFPMGENTQTRGFKLSDIPEILNGSLKTLEYRPPYLQSSMTAFNDIVIKTGKVARCMKYELRAGKKTMKGEGDGVIVSTPLGSTAYNFAAGGRILPLRSEKTVVTPLAPFRGDKKSMLVEQGRVISFKILEKQGDVWEIADGSLIKPAKTLIKISRKKALCRIVFPAVLKTGGIK